MARKGRELEELIAILEKGLSDKNIKVTSPDFIEDKTTKEKREVDISLKGKMGSNDILIIIECRDRKAKQDVTWIEQIATKKDDIGAHKAIAVSSRGFSEAARKKAIAKNIELRTLEEIDPIEIVEWFQPAGLKIYNPKFNILKLTLLYDKCLNSSQVEELHKFLKLFSGAFPLDHKFIIDPEANDTLSINDCVLRNIYKISEDAKLFEDSKSSDKKIIQITIIPQNKEIGFFASTPSGLIRIECIELNIEIWLETTESKITSVSSYQIEGTSLAQIISFDGFDTNGVKRFAQIRRIPNGDKQLIEFLVKELD